jgi:hypothetical protein
VQCCKEAELLSTMKPNWRFLKQVLRWTRNTWRSDLRSLFMERHIWTSHPYVAYTMVDKLFNPLTLLVGPCLVSYLIYKSTIPIEQGGYHLPWWNILLSYMVWLTATRTAKLLPHLWNTPQHVIYVPAFILFGYYFALMKIYALFTLHETGWGTRAGIGDASAATAAADAENEKSAAANNHNLKLNHPYQQQQYRLPTPLSSDSLSPFRDPPPSSYRDLPPIQTGRLGQQGSMRRRGDHEEVVEMQVGYAR